MYTIRRIIINDKFFALPIEKQRRIINAAYRVFSENSYKKAPMSEIAEEGNISKSLLFHYFTNKKDLYMYLWDNACEITTQAIREYKTLDTDDFLKCSEELYCPNVRLCEIIHICMPFLSGHITKQIQK